MKIFPSDDDDYVFCIIIADVPDEMITALRKELCVIDKKNKEKHGLAIIVGIVGGGPSGVKKDMETMSKVFTKIKLAVWEKEDATSATITGMLHVVSTFPFRNEYKLIFFYFSGHGGSMDGKAFIRTSNKSNNMLFIEKGIVSHLLPKNATLKQYVRRIFLFDSCLVDNTVRYQPAPRQEEISIPPYSNVVIAYATSMTSTARANEEEGGVWTRFLAHNMENMDLSFTTVLEFTWYDTVKHLNKVFEDDIRLKNIDPQGPQYTSSTGPIFLHRKWICCLPVCVYMQSLPHPVDPCVDPDWDLMKNRKSIPCGPLQILGGELI